jgi:hypothetical protein
MLKGVFSNMKNEAILDQIRWKGTVAEFFEDAAQRTPHVKGECPTSRAYCEDYKESCEKSYCWLKN